VTRVDPPLQFRTPHSAFGILLLLLLAGRAQAQVDPSGPWRTLHTPHFRIHFRPAYRDVALLEAREAERSYRLLSSELHPPRGVVDLTLADDIDASNGFTAVFPSSRITIFAAPPAGGHGLLFYDSWLRLVTTHELAHVFHLDRSRGLWSGLQHVFGRAPGLFPNEYQPSWVIEGLATYYESKFTNGGRVRGSFHTQLLAADRVAGASRSPWDALLFARWADGLVPYAYGSRFFHSLAGAAGDSVVPRFVEATAGQWIPFRVGRQVARAAPGHTLADEWRRGTQPEPGAGEQEAGATDRILDSGLRSEPVPRVSPDGRRVAYLRDDGKGAGELRVADAATFRTLATHRVNGEAEYDWVGDTLVIAQLDFTSRWTIRSDQYRWLPGAGWRRESHGARIVVPAGGGGRRASLTLSTASSAPTIGAPAGPAGAVWEDLVLSPDGRRAAGTRVAGGQRDLVRWPIDAPGEGATLVATQAGLADPVWTPRGELWFVADPTGFPQVYRWRATGGAEALTDRPLGARAPAPLPDGTFFYAGLDARGWDLRRAAPLTGGKLVTFPEPLPFDSAPAVPVRETGYAAWPSLRPHFWLPVFQDEGPTGRFAGALTAGTDALGRFAYAADLLAAARPFRMGGDFALVSAAFGNPTIDLSGSAAWTDLTPPAAAPRTLSELEYDAALGATFAGRGWRRLASLRVAGELERLRFAATPDTALATLCTGCNGLDLYGGSVTLTLSRVVLGALAVSPEDGATWSVTYRRREEQGSSRWSNELRSRLALYTRAPGVGGFAHSVLAVRLLAGGSNGPLGTLFRVGGVAPQGVSVFFAPSLSATRAFPLRGYRDDELAGERAVAGSIEYRAPLALVGRALGHLPVGLDKLWLNFFADAGDAWNPGTSPRLTRLRSTGLELAGDVALSYDFILSVRLGVAEPLAVPPSGVARRPQAYAALGSDF